MTKKPEFRNRYNPFDIRFYYDLYWYFKFHSESVFRRVCPQKYELFRMASEYIRGITGNSVLAGPFKRMKYVSSSIGSVYESKLLGVYEKELHELIERICSRPYEIVLNIGAAEGYYAVGFAMRMQKVRILAFDGESSARDLLVEMANLNGVGRRIDVKGFCSTDEMTAGLAGAAGRKLVFMDVDGGEYELLNPSEVPGLTGCDILVEIHECLRRENMEEVIESRFKETHRMERIKERERTLKDLPFEPQGPRMLLWGLRRLLHEQRGCPQEWLFMEALNKEKK